MADFHYDEDLNSGDGDRYWSFLIERDDVGGNNTSSKIDNKCPFTTDIKHYIERVIRDAVSMSIDEFNIRNFAVLTNIVTKLHSKLASKNQIPSIGRFRIMGDPSGVRVIIHAGTGYAVGYEWTIYNEHKDVTIDWYDRSGINFVREFISKVAPNPKPSKTVTAGPAPRGKNTNSKKADKKAGTDDWT